MSGKFYRCLILFLEVDVLYLWQFSEREQRILHLVTSLLTLKSLNSIQIAVSIVWPLTFLNFSNVVVHLNRIEVLGFLDLI